MATWNELIDLVYVKLGVTQPGEAITTALRTDGQSALNQLLGILSSEGATVYTQKTYTAALQANVPRYTVGVGGTMVAINERVQRLTSWQCISGDLADGGPVVSLEQLGAAMRAEQERIAGIALQAVMAGQLTAFPASITKAVPSIVGADTAYPLINLHVFPTPSAASTIVLAGWTPLAQIADFTVTPTLPDGWPNLLMWGSAVQLYSTYGRAGGQSLDVIAGNYQAAKAGIVNQNTAGKPTGGE